VSVIDKLNESKFPFIIEWCAQVTEIPEDNKIIVFNNGTFIASNGKIPIGGQQLPIVTSGANLTWKNAQKKDKKKKISEIINKIIPHRSPISTILECMPWKLPSCLTSFHHWNIVNKIIISPKNIKIEEFKWNQDTKPIVNEIPPTELIKGQGDSLTKW